MAAPPTREPEQHELTRALEILLDRTETVTEAGARRGVCSETIRRRIRSGEIVPVVLGRDIRVWR